ncbi:MAG: hypothetical protein WAS55_08825 [Saprospiraceae bacterium]
MKKYIHFVNYRAFSLFVQIIFLMLISFKAFSQLTYKVELGAESIQCLHVSNGIFDFDDLGDGYCYAKISFNGETPRVENMYKIYCSGAWVNKTTCQDNVKLKRNERKFNLRSPTNITRGRSRLRLDDVNDMRVQVTDLYDMLNLNDDWYVQEQFWRLSDEVDKFQNLQAGKEVKLRRNFNLKQEDGSHVVITIYVIIRAISENTDCNNAIRLNSNSMTQSNNTDINLTNSFSSWVLFDEDGRRTLRGFEGKERVFKYNHRQNGNVVVLFNSPNTNLRAFFTLTCVNQTSFEVRANTAVTKNLPRGDWFIVIDSNNGEEDNFSIKVRSE